LPSQMACNVPRQVGATYKGLWTKVKQNAAAKAKGYTKKRYKGLDAAPRFSSPVLTYNLGSDYGFKHDNKVSINTLNGRVVVGYEGYSKDVNLIQNGGQLGAAKLWYNKPKKQFYLLVSIAIEQADSMPTGHKQIVGVDVGRRYLAVATNIQNTSQFFPGKKIVHQANHYARLRKRLQQKGTRSAKVRLMSISMRERRLKLDANHVVSKCIIKQFPKAVIGLEELSGIRERTRRKAGQRASIKQRKANAVASK
jgi:putative transposase